MKAMSPFSVYMDNYTKNFAYQFKRSAIITIIMVIRLSLFRLSFFPKLKIHLNRFFQFLNTCVSGEGTLVNLNLRGGTDFGKVPTQHLINIFDGK